MRIVFDTNLVVSALVFGRRLAWLRTAWANGALVPIVCRETTAELLRVLVYPKFRLAKIDREALLQDFLPHAETTTIPRHRPAVPPACRDRDDVVFIELAAASGADALVSGDTDLTQLRHILPVRLLTVTELRAQTRSPD